MTSTHKHPHPPTAVMNGRICLRSCSLCRLTWRVHWRSDAPRGSTNVSAVAGYTPTDPRANNGRARPDTWEHNTPMQPAVAAAAAAADCWVLLTDSLSSSNQWSPPKQTSISVNYTNCSIEGKGTDLYFLHECIWLHRHTYRPWQSEHVSRHN